MIIVWLLYDYYMIIVWLLYDYYMIIIWSLYGILYPYDILIMYSNGCYMQAPQVELDHTQTLKP